MALAQALAMALAQAMAMAMAMALAMAGRWCLGEGTARTTLEIEDTWDDKK